MKSGDRWSLAGQLLVLQVTIVGMLVGVGAVLAYLDVADRTEDSSRAEVVAIALTIADSPLVVDAVEGADPSAVLQPYAERIRHDTGVDFVTIMDPAGRRHTHPNPDLIGQRFLGHTAEALAGRTFTETYTGTLGPSVRAVVPVFGAGRDVVALVSVGITLDAIAGEVRDLLVPLVIIALVVLAAGTAGTYLVNRRLAKRTRGLGPAELSRRLEYHEQILHTVREGLLLIDQDGRVTLCNDGARELLGLAGDEPAEGRELGELGLPPALVAGMGRTTRDEIQLTEQRVLVVNSAPVDPHGRVVTLRDHTDLQALTGELNSVRGFAESLRSQAHEAANRLHTVVSLVEMGRTEEAVEFATAELAVAQQLTDRVVGAVSEPVLAALLLGKAAEANERGAELVITPETEIDDAVLGAEAAVARDVVTILGNLIDNAVDAALDGTGAPRVFVTARVEPAGDAVELVLRVADTGPGLAAESVPDAFDRGWSTKADPGRGLGLALVRQAVRRNDGTIDVGSRVGGGAEFTVRLRAGRLLEKRS